MHGHRRNHTIAERFQTAAVSLLTAKAS
jgi:hypothetical protein